jgi:hypothetical protein
VKGLRDANLRYVKDVAGSRARKIAQNVRHVGDRIVRSRGDYDCYGFDRLRAAATGHAGWRTGTVILTRLLVTRAGLCNDQGVGAGGAERQQRHDDCEGEPPHEASVASRLELVGAALSSLEYAARTQGSCACARNEERIRIHVTTSFSPVPTNTVEYATTCRSELCRSCVRSPGTAGKHRRLRVHIKRHSEAGSRCIDCVKRCFGIARMVSNSQRLAKSVLIHLCCSGQAKCSALAYASGTSQKCHAP